MARALQKLVAPLRIAGQPCALTSTSSASSWRPAASSWLPVVRCQSTSAAADAADRPYEIRPILPHFAAEAWGMSLAADDTGKPLPQDVIFHIKEDMRRYRVLVFKDQGLVSGERQVQISKQLGEIESTFYKHPRSPHPDIFRVSNDEREGCTQVGRTGWHIDGTFQAMPFKYQTMHFHSICDGGETWFIPLREFYEMQDREIQERWDRLWMITGRQVVHPVVYEHPVRGDVTMMFHCGAPFCAGWGIDDDAPATDSREMSSFLRPGVFQGELTRKLDAAVAEIGLKMKWEVGDFAINDNLGNAHFAPPGTQNPRGDAGLRVLHRTTIAGENVPRKFDGRMSKILADF